MRVKAATELLPLDTGHNLIRRGPDKHVLIERQPCLSLTGHGRVHDTFAIRGYDAEQGLGSSSEQVWSSWDAGVHDQDALIE